MPNENEGLKIQVGSFEGAPVYNHISDSEINEMLAAGLTMDDIIEISSIPPDSLTWQRDC